MGSLPAAWAMFAGVILRNNLHYIRLYLELLVNLFGATTVASFDGAIDGSPIADEVRARRFVK